MPRSEWPNAVVPLNVSRVLRSSRFLVQVYDAVSGAVRLSCSRTMVDSTENYVTDLTWEELQRLKSEAGYDSQEAVEIYPPDRDVVNVANMRHLWVLPIGKRMPFSWVGQKS